MREKRKFSRLKSQDKAFLKEKDRAEEGKLLDISPGGMRILLSNNIKVGSAISGEFKIIPKSGGTFYVQGEVVWAKQASEKSSPDSFEVGIKFRKVSTVPF